MNLRKDILLTFGSMAAVGAVVFGIGFLALSFLVKPLTAAHAPAAHGAEKTDAHGKHEPKKTADKKTDDKKTDDKHGAHGDGADEASHDAKPHKKDEGHTSGETAGTDPNDQLAELDKKYKAHIAKGMHDDARTVASKAFTITPKNDPEWLKRSADATFQSTDMGSQQRHAKAMASYIDLLNSTSANLNEEHREWAQWRICECLQNLMHFDDAIRAMKAYLGEYPRNPRRHEIRLKYAQCLVAGGRTPEALNMLDLIKGDDVPKEIDARALNERARIILERSKNDVPDAPIQVASPTAAPIVPKDHVVPSKESAALKDVINAIDSAHGDEGTDAAATVPDMHHAEVPPNHDVPPTAHEEPATVDGVPSATWAAIRSAVQEAEFTKVSELMKPYIDHTSTFSQQQRAQVMLRYAGLLTEVTQSGRK